MSEFQDARPHGKAMNGHNKEKEAAISMVCNEWVQDNVNKAMDKLADDPSPEGSEGDGIEDAKSIDDMKLRSRSKSIAEMDPRALQHRVDRVKAEEARKAEEEEAATKLQAASRGRSTRVMHQCLLDGDRAIVKVDHRARTSYELSVKAGEVIALVSDREAPAGWAFASSARAVGLVPSFCLGLEPGAESGPKHKVVPEEHDPETLQAAQNDVEELRKKAEQLAMDEDGPASPGQEGSPTIPKLALGQIPKGGPVKVKASPGGDEDLDSLDEDFFNSAEYQALTPRTRAELKKGVHRDLYSNALRQYAVRDQRTQHRREQVQQKELEHCTFQPNMMTSDKVTVSERQREGGVFQRLYTIGQEKAAKNAEIIADDFSFKQVTEQRTNKLDGLKEPNTPSHLVENVEATAELTGPKNPKYNNVAPRVYSPKTNKEAPADMKDAHPPLKPTLIKNDKYKHVESRLGKPTPTKAERNEPDHQPTLLQKKKYDHVQSRAVAKAQTVGESKAHLAGAKPAGKPKSPRPGSGGKSPRNSGEGASPGAPAAAAAAKSPRATTPTKKPPPRAKSPRSQSPTTTPPEGRHTFGTSERLPFKHPDSPSPGEYNPPPSKTTPTSKHSNMGLTTTRFAKNETVSPGPGAYGAVGINDAATMSGSMSKSKGAGSSFSSDSVRLKETQAEKEAHSTPAPGEFTPMDSFNKMKKGSGASMGITAERFPVNATAGPGPGGYNHK